MAPVDDLRSGARVLADTSLGGDQVERTDRSRGEGPRIAAQSTAELCMAKGYWW
jgi:hypothetical protein